MRKHWLFLIVALLASFTLWGCGSSRDSSDVGALTPGIGEAETVGNCTVCHTFQVHAFVDPLVGTNPDTVQVLGSAIQHDCENCHGGGQYHHGTGPIPYPSPDVARCSACHELPAWYNSETAEMVAAPKHENAGQPGCVLCHQPLNLTPAYGVDSEDSKTVTFLDTSTLDIPELICNTCHDSAFDGANPFFPEIYSRFETSRHAIQHARTGFCSACHSDEGGQILLAMGRFNSRADFLDAYTEENVGEVYTLPEAEVGGVLTPGDIGIHTKTCATCHDTHTDALRGDGEVLGTFTWDDDSDPATPDVTEETTVYSTEFNLCTQCHMVDLVPTPAGHGDAGLLLSYELSDKYLAANMAPDGTEIDSDNFVFYHEDRSNRTILDTHFSGTVVEGLLLRDDFNLNDVVITGYNVNAAAEDSCTICHDPHTAGKMLSATDAVTTDYPDNSDNFAVGYAEGVGQFHTNYLGDAMGHGCAPCHNGEEFAKLVEDGTASTAYGSVAPIGCRSCHDLAVENDNYAANSPATYAPVRTFADAAYVFEFETGTVVAVADLGVNQICFECHKGRTGTLTPTEEAALPAGETEIRVFTYLHYAPAFATLFGTDSGMISEYGGTYNGRFVHPNNGTLGDATLTEFGCVDCHDVHNTDGNDVALNKMANPAFDCNTCHGAADVDARNAETATFSDALLDTIYNEMMTYIPAGVVDPTLTNAGLIAALEDMNAAATVAEAKAILATHLEGRTNVVPTVALAKASNSWKIFTYEDGAVHGNFEVHGHGGSWAHNGDFAEQVMYDAISSLGVDPVTIYSLTRP